MADQVTFNASLNDNVTPNLEKLERQLQKMGKSPVEIKMILQAVDDATPKLKQAQEQMNRMPKKHRMQISVEDSEGRPFNRALDAFKNQMRTFREEVTKPIKTPFQLVDDNGNKIDDLGEHLFKLRSKVAMPLMGGLPGSNMLYGVGMGAGVAGAVTGVTGVMKDSFNVNQQMEQQQQMLAQTLKDQQGATREMQKVVTYAQTTPFQYQDVLKANVLARSYGMPSLPGESKQVHTFKTKD